MCIRDRKYFGKIEDDRGRWKYQQECAAEFMHKFFHRKAFPAQGLIGVGLGKRMQCSVCKERWWAGPEGSPSIAPEPWLDLPVPDEPDGPLSVQGLLDTFLAEEALVVPAAEGAPARQSPGTDGEAVRFRQSLEPEGGGTVSYTHLTLPTKRIV